jgi:hypothetical protein
MGGNVLKKFVLVAFALGEAAAATAQAPAAQQAAAIGQQTPAATGQQAGPGEPKALAGMSILGNQEAPKSLVIVPWKSSEIGNGIGVSRALDTRIRAVDKDVFMRELKYYAIRSGAQK